MSNLAEKLAGELEAQEKPTPVDRLLMAGLALSSAALVVLSIIFMVKMVGADAPGDIRENAIVLTTDLLVRGQNPYDLEHQPLYINVYGLGYHWVVLPFARLTGAGFPVHRAVSMAAILLTCSALGYGLWRTGVAWPLALAAGALWLIQYSRGLSILARPDSVGMLWFYLSVLLPCLSRFATWSLIASLILGVLGFLTKPYFVFGIPCLAAYLFLFRSKGIGLLYAVGGATLLALALLAMNHYYPCYLTDTFFIHVNVAQRSYGHLRRVAGNYLFGNAGILCIFILAGGMAAIDWWRDRRANAPTSSLSPGLMPFMLVCCTTAIVTLLGLHTGNGRLYYDQLISPFLYWMVFGLIGRFPRFTAPFVVLLLANLWAMPDALQCAPTYQKQQWRGMAKLISEHKDVYATPALAHLLQRQNRPIYNTGQTEYFRYGSSHNASATTAAFLRRGQRFVDDILAKAARQEFDLILLSRGDEPFIPKDKLLGNNYVLVGTKPITMHFGKTAQVQIYRPRKDPN